MYWLRADAAIMPPRCWAGLCLVALFLTVLWVLEHHRQADDPAREGLGVRGWVITVVGAAAISVILWALDLWPPRE